MKNKLKFFEKGCIEILKGHSSHCFPLHSHESFCLGAVLDGSALFTIGNKSKLLQKGTVFIIPSDTGVIIRTDSSYNYVTICIKNEFKEALKNICFSDYFFSLNDNFEILQPIDIFLENLNEEQLFTSCLHIMSQVVDSSHVKSQKSPLINKVCEYIKTHALDKFSLEELVSTFYISKFHLVRTFKKEMGVTPRQYHLQEKMRLVKHDLLLSQSETSIAIDKGLADQSHLCRLFKLQMGVSPIEYIKNHTRK